MKRPRQGVMRNQISKIIVKGGKNHWLKHTRTQPTSRTCYSSTAVKCWHCRGLSRTRRDLYKRWLDPRSWGLNIIQQSHKVLAIKLPLCHVFQTQRRLPSLLCNNSVCKLETSNTTLFFIAFLKRMNCTVVSRLFLLFFKTNAWSQEWMIWSYPTKPHTKS